MALCGFEAGLEKLGTRSGAGACRRCISVIVEKLLKKTNIENNYPSQNIEISRGWLTKRFAIQKLIECFCRVTNFFLFPLTAKNFSVIMYVSSWTTAAVYRIGKHPSKTNLSDVFNGQVVAPLSNINVRVVFVTARELLKRTKEKQELKYI